MGKQKPNTLKTSVFSIWPYFILKTFNRVAFSTWRTWEAKSIALAAPAMIGSEVSLWSCSHAKILQLGLWGAFSFNVSLLGLLLLGVLLRILSNIVNSHNSASSSWNCRHRPPHQADSIFVSFFKIYFVSDYMFLYLCGCAPGCIAPAEDRAMGSPGSGTMWYEC